MIDNEQSQTVTHNCEASIESSESADELLGVNDYLDYFYFLSLECKRQPIALLKASTLRGIRL